MVCDDERIGVDFKAPVLVYIFRQDQLSELESAAVRRRNRQEIIKEIKAVRQNTMCIDFDSGRAGFQT